MKITPPHNRIHPSWRTHNHHLHLFTIQIRGIFPPQLVAHHRNATNRASRQFKSITPTSVAPTTTSHHCELPLIGNRNLVTHNVRLLSGWHPVGDEQNTSSRHLELRSIKDSNVIDIQSASDHFLVTFWSISLFIRGSEFIKETSGWGDWFNFPLSVFKDR